MAVHKQHMPYATCCIYANATGACNRVATHNDKIIALKRKFNQISLISVRQICNLLQRFLRLLNFRKGFVINVVRNTILSHVVNFNKNQTHYKVFCSNKIIRLIKFLINLLQIFTANYNTV